MIPSWYNQATGNLQKELLNSDKNKLNGHQFLIDFFSEDENLLHLDLESNYSEEELQERLDEFVGEEIDEFELWLKKEHPDKFDIKARYNWLNKHTPSILPQKQLEQVDFFELTEDEHKLLQLPISNISRENTDKIYALLEQKLLNLGNLEFSYNATLRVAWGRDKDVEISITDKAKAWEKAAETAVAIGSNESDKWYIKAAEYRNRHLEHDKSAKLYEEAFNLANEKKATNSELLKVLRNSRKQYEASGDEKSASRIFILECDLVRDSSKFHIKSILHLYKLLSKYGEGPHYVAAWCAGVICVCACLYAWIGITPTYGNESDLNPLTYMYYSVVTFTTLGYGDFRPPEGWARFVSGVEAMLGLILTSLLLVTIVRKFSRN